MTVLVEERMRFDFGPSWRVVKYDELTIYREGIERLKEESSCRHCGRGYGVGSGAVDFVGVYKGQPYFIEVKDFRRHRVENKYRAQGGVAIEVALKVRDTLAGLLGVCREDDWRPLIEPIFKQPPKVLLWLEQDRHPSGFREDGHKTTLIRQLQRHLSWLHSGVMVMNQDKLPSDLDLRVRNLSDRACTLWKLVGGNLAEKRTISRDAFATAWSVPPQTAGEELKRLCDKGILKRDATVADCYEAGEGWAKLLDE